MVRIYGSVKPQRDGTFRAMLMVRNERGQMHGSICSADTYADKIAARNAARIVAYHAAAKARLECPGTEYEVKA